MEHSLNVKLAAVFAVISTIFYLFGENLGSYPIESLIPAIGIYLALVFVFYFVILSILDLVIYRHRKKGDD